MGNILDYLDWRGDLTFEQSPFNEVDNLILACFSYLDLDEMAEVKNGNTLSVEELFAAFSRREMKKELKAALEKAEAALADHKDQHLRLMAEYQNYRNRTTEEKKKIYGDAKADCIKSLLTVVDTFERAMDAACSDETYKKGIEMTFSQLQKALEQMGVKEIAEVGVEFDPNLHNAIKQMDDTDFEENKVCQIYQKGYLLGDRLIRPAMVAVSV